MSRLLYIEASPRKERSASIEVAKAFLDAYRQAHPAAVIDKLDLWAETLPEFNGHMLAAKYAVLSAQDPTPEQRAAWAQVEAIAARLKGADKLVIATPMWNFAIPYKLKHWIDIVTQPGITFGYDPAKGYFGLVEGKQALCIYARGGEYAGDAAAYDQQTKYLAQALGFMGITEQTAITIDRGLHGPEADRGARDAAKARAVALATAF
jgi:FMN-dependent NADH-azoreductase